MIVIKLGGSTLDLAIKDAKFFETLRGLEGQAVLVHGGGPSINQLLKRLQLSSEFLDGQRVTTPEVLIATEMALSGEVNPLLVRHCLSVGIKAFGLSGVDGGLFQCQFENPLLGQVGRIQQVNVQALTTLLTAGYLPVLSPIGIFDQQTGSSAGLACNINADLAAAAVAQALKAQNILFLTDRDGILDANNHLIEKLNLKQLQELEDQGIIQGGMLVKSRAIQEMLLASPQSMVRVVNGNDPQKLSQALAGVKQGTVVGF